MDAIENKVAKSGLITLDLEELRPAWKIAGFDISDVLDQGFVLREKDFRAFVKEHDWNAFKGHEVYITCSTEAIVPTWAYMLISSALVGICKTCVFGSETDLRTELWMRYVQSMNFEGFSDKRVIVKGCSNEEIHQSVYIALAKNLTPWVKSLMFGEPCSTVPIFKR